MNTASALSILAQVEKLLDSSMRLAQQQEKLEAWQRDKAFVLTARDCLLSGERERVRWVFDQMRNLSQGFGSYCGDLGLLDALIDKLYLELLRLITVSNRLQHGTNGDLG